MPENESQGVKIVGWAGTFLLPRLQKKSWNFGRLHVMFTVKMGIF